LGDRQKKLRGKGTRQRVGGGAPGKGKERESDKVLRTKRPGPVNKKGEQETLGKETGKCGRFTSQLRQAARRKKPSNGLRVGVENSKGLTKKKKKKKKKKKILPKQPGCFRAQKSTPETRKVSALETVTKRPAEGCSGSGTMRAKN